MKDMNTDNITKNTILINSQGHDKRLQYLMERMVTHVHDFARETRLSTKEWKAGLDFLVQIGQISTDVRHVSQKACDRLPQAETDSKVGIHFAIRRARIIAPRRCN